MKFLDKILKRKSPPVIMTDFGPVSEPARKQAALNMKADPAIKARVEKIIIEQTGSEELGLSESRRRYPEAYE